LLFIICYLLFALAACSEPSTEETGKGYFTISLSASENMRAAYPPSNTSDLSFVAKFKNTASGAEQTYTSDGSGTIQGKIDVGNYIVTMAVSLISDGSSYARGIAYDNPVAIGSGKNQIKAYAYDVKNATPPVISAKPQGATYANGATAAALSVTASVNDGGLISYQWYSNTTNSVIGATIISGATSASYTPSTATPGTVWNYVVVTNTNTGRSTTISTVPVAIEVGAKPEPGPGTGTVADPFLVNDVAGLQKVGTGTDGWGLSAHYKQTADISLPAVSLGGSNWTPIGSEATRFTGSYDGNGKTISNLTINAPTEDNQGLFGYIGDPAVVKNVGLVNCSIIGNQRVGGVVGELTGTVQDCYATGTVYTNNFGVGGVVGENNGTVQNCYATCNVSGGSDGSLVGGVVGWNFGIVQNCYATGTVSGYWEIGGVVGGNNGTVQNCYATSTVSGDVYIGGVVGDNNGTVQDCYATGNVSGYVVGGVVGVLSNNDSSSIAASVINCVALNPDVSSASGTDIGRVLGNLSTTPTFANNYGRNDMKKNGSGTTWTNIGLNDLDGASITSANWGSQNWWTTASNWKTGGWDFTKVWQWGGSLPILRNMPGTATQNHVVK